MTVGKGWGPFFSDNHGDYASLARRNNLDGVAKDHGTVEAGKEEIERRSCKAGGGNLFGSSRVRTLLGVFGLLAFLRDRRLPAHTLEERDAVLDWNCEV